MANKLSDYLPSGSTIDVAWGDLTGTLLKSEFDAACSDGDFAFSGGAYHDGFSDYDADEHIDWTVDDVKLIHIDNIQTFGTSQAGKVPQSGGGTTNFLRADGTWAAPAGSGSVSEVTVGTGLGVTNGTTTPDITLALTNLSPVTTELISTDFVICLDGTVERKITLVNLATELEAIGGWGSGSGTVTEVTVGTGLDVATGTTTPNITLSLDEFSEKTGDLVGTDRLVVVSGLFQYAETISNIPLSIFDNDLGAGSGTVTEVTVGTGLDVATGTTTPDITLDFTEFTETTSFDHTGGDVGAEDSFVIYDLSVASPRRIIAGNIPLSAFDNDLGGGSGTVTSVSAGSGMDFTTITTTGSVSIDASQTAISSMYNTALRVGYNTSNYIDFNSADFDVVFDGVVDFRFNDGGAFEANGNITAYSSSISSDRKLKKNIQPIENAVSKTRSITGCTFEMRRDGSRRAGVIAQDVEKVLPCAVGESKDLNTGEPFKTVDYNAVIGLLVQAVNDLSKRVEELEHDAKQR